MKSLVTSKYKSNNLTQPFWNYLAVICNHWTVYLQVLQDLVWNIIQKDSLTAEVLLLSLWVLPFTTVITLCYLIQISFSTYWFSVTFHNYFDCTGCMTTKVSCDCFKAVNRKTTLTCGLCDQISENPIIACFPCFVSDVTDHVLPCRLQPFVSGRLSASSDSHVGYVDRKDSI